MIAGMDPYDVAGDGDNHGTAGGSRRLRRADEGRVVAGVAGGLASHLGVEASVVRIAFVLLTITGGASLGVYLACWLLIPAEHQETSVLDDALATWWDRQDRDPRGYFDRRHRCQHDRYDRGPESSGTWL